MQCPSASAGFLLHEVLFAADEAVASAPVDRNTQEVGPKDKGALSDPPGASPTAMLVLFAHVEPEQATRLPASGQGSDCACCTTR